MGIKNSSSNLGRLPSSRVKATRGMRPFGMTQTPFDPQKGKHLPLTATPTPSLEVELARVTVKSEDDDWLVCNFVSNGQEVYVAKPYTLRRTPFDGETVNTVTYSYSAANTRTASKSGETDETQYITPDYYVGEELLVASHDTGLVSTLSDIIWEDVNTAGRAWATEPI